HRSQRGGEDDLFQLPDGTSAGGRGQGDLRGGRPDQSAARDRGARGRGANVSAGEGLSRDERPRERGGGRFPARADATKRARGGGAGAPADRAGRSRGS